MVSRKVLKDNLNDSLRLSRERLKRMHAEKGQDGEEQEEETYKAEKTDGESKFEDSREAGRGSENVQRGNERSRNSTGHKKKSAQLLEYLDEAKCIAEGERDEVVQSFVPLSSARSSVRYDWEGVDGNTDDQRSCFGGAPPAAPQASDSPSVVLSASSSRRSLSYAGESSRGQVSLRMELEERGKTIDALRKALERSRTEIGSVNERASVEASQKMQELREEHDQAVKRHLSFIDKLLADKKQLAGKVEELSQRSRDSDEQSAKALRELEKKHAAESKALRESLAAQDAAKRAKWQKEKCKELKELTIKGLEPEVQSILAKHKEDLRVVEDRFKDEVRALRDAGEKELRQQMGELKARHAAELEESRSKEREAMALKLRQQELRHKDEMEAARVRFEREFGDLRNRHRDELSSTEAKLRERAEEIAQVRTREVAAEKTSLQSQLDTLHAKLEMEKQAWQQEQIVKLEERGVAEERRLRASLLAERDKQIDAVIDKLYAEQETKLANLAAQHAKELAERVAREEAAVEAAAHSAGEWKQKYERLREAREQDKRTGNMTEQRVRELEGQAERREQRIVDLSKKVAAINDLLAEREQAVRQEYADKMRQNVKATADQSEKLSELRAEVAKLEASKKQELVTQKIAFEEETEEIHRRVRLTVSRKDETISSLRLQVEELREQLESYKELMDKQRNEFLGVH